MARRKPAPHYKPGLYEIYKAFAGFSSYSIMTGRVISATLKEFSGGACAAYLYTVETPGAGCFGSGRMLVWEHELDQRMIRSVPAQRKAA